MSPVTVQLVKAFTRDPAAGNPAGVVLQADGLSERTMQSIAAQLGYSESAFVMRSRRADLRVRFFSPTQDVGFCGHATVAAFHALLGAGKIDFAGAKRKRLTQETKIGILPVDCSADGLVMMTQSPPVFGIVELDRKRIANMIGFDDAELADLPIQVVSTGTPKLIVPVRSLAALQAIRPDLAAIRQYCKETGARGIYVFTSETLDPEADFHARQFNPLAGIDEDPVTGVAAGALACYARAHGLSTKQNFIAAGFGFKKLHV